MTLNSSGPWLRSTTVLAWTPFNWKSRGAKGEMEVGKNALLKTTQQVSDSWSLNPVPQSKNRLLPCQKKKKQASKANATWLKMKLDKNQHVCLTPNYLTTHPFLEKNLKSCWVYKAFSQPCKNSVYLLARHLWAFLNHLAKEYYFSI